jgi:hypothetical protein
MKTRFPQISVALSLLLSVSYLAAAPKVVSDYDPNANFSAYKTFMCECCSRQCVPRITPDRDGQYSVQRLALSCFVFESNRSTDSAAD